MPALLDGRRLTHITEYFLTIFRFRLFRHFERPFFRNLFEKPYTLLTIGRLSHKINSTLITSLRPNIGFIEAVNANLVAVLIY
jgi:hypothetical protein